MLIRLCKTSLVATVALFFTLVAFGNLTDYDSNWNFVRHVLAMDTIFPDSTLTWRAVTAEWAQSLAYWLIIAWEALTALLLWIAVAGLLAAAGSAERFRRARPLAVLGLTLGALLYALGFIVVGGEWFAMWQSATWNGQESAARFLIVIGLALIPLLIEER